MRLGLDTLIAVVVHELLLGLSHGVFVKRGFRLELGRGVRVDFTFRLGADRVVLRLIDVLENLVLVATIRLSRAVGGPGSGHVDVSLAAAHCAQRRLVAEFST